MQEEDKEDNVKTRIGKFNENMAHILKLYENKNLKKINGSDNIKVTWGNVSKILSAHFPATGEDPVEKPEVPVVTTPISKCVLILGGPRSGKKTQAKILQEKFGIW